MIRFFKVIFLVAFGAVTVVSCKKEDAVELAPPRPYAEQEPIERAEIDKFLDSYNMTVNANQDVDFTEIPSTNPNNLKTIRQEFGSTGTNQLKDTLIKIDDVNHKLYYIKVAEGTQLKPSRLDSIFVSYKGKLLDNTVFEQTVSPNWFNLSGTIRGWSEVLSKFKTGTFDGGNNGSFNYKDFGVGVLFIPSALAYYNSGSATIGAYKPLIFSFKLYHLNYIDHDFDGIDSKDEGIISFNRDTNQDTDGDGAADFLDQDDDGDGYFTKYEIKKSSGGYYTFDNIPLCSDNKKKHLSKACY